MKKKLSTAVLVLVLLVGLGFLLYPTVSDYLKTLAYNRAIENFKSSVVALDDETYEDILAEAAAYNEKLLAIGKIRTSLKGEELAAYERQMVIDESGVMGYVVIPKIHVSLPIYHGTSDAVLQSGVGHLEGSSLPIGGAGTHTVLSAHRGLPSAKLFTNIDQLAVGDTFTVRVLREVLTYEVDDVRVVLPSKVSALKVEKDGDYCTLLTCTPYGVNSHRLLVRGRRIPTPAGETAQSFDSLTTAQSQKEYWPLFAVGAAAVLLVGVAVGVGIAKKKKRRAKSAAEK